MFVSALLALFVFNQTLVIWFGGGEVRKIFSERQLEQNLQWSRQASLPDDTNELKLDMLNILRVARPDEVMVFSMALDEATPDLANSFLLPSSLGSAQITQAPVGPHFPLISRALIEVGGARWDATRLIAPDRIVVSMVNEAANERHVEEFMIYRKRMVQQILPLSLLLAILGAFLLSRRVLAPIKRIQKSLRELDYRDLSVRIPTRSEDNEFREFIDTFNAMLERLEKGFLQASRFSSDAAHELRTPLTIMQGYVERSINEAETGSRLQMQLYLISDEIQRLTSITQKLLLLAQADAGRLQMDFEVVNVSEMLEEMRCDVGTLDPPLQLRGTIEKQLLLRTDRVLFQQLLNNLFSNAVKYNEPGGWIEISAWAATDQLRIRFANASGHISDDFSEKMFERFSRADASRSRRIDGTGLGLSLCREIALANGGSLTVRIETHTKVIVDFRVPLHV